MEEHPLRRKQGEAGWSLGRAIWGESGPVSAMAGGKESAARELAGIRQEASLKKMDLAFKKSRLGRASGGAAEQTDLRPRR